MLNKNFISSLVFVLLQSTRAFSEYCEGEEKFPIQVEDLSLIDESNIMTELNSITQQYLLERDKLRKSFKND